MLKTSFETTTLDNGIQTTFQRVEGSEAIYMNIEFDNAGSRYSPDHLPETAHFMEHMIFEGCEQYPSRDDFQEVISGNGAQSNAHTHGEMMSYELATPRIDYMPPILAMLSAIEKPAFLDDALATEREVVREELVGYLNQDNQHLWPRVSTSAGLPMPDLGYRIDQLDGITADDVRNHHSTTHTTDAMRVILTGRLTKSEKAAVIERLSGLDLQGHQQVAVKTSELIQPDAVVHVDRPSKSNIYYVLGKIGLPLVSYEQVACQDIIESYLFDYQNAAIYRRARQEGLAYGVGGSFDEDTRSRQKFYVYGNVSEKNATALLKVIREGITEVFVNPNDKLLTQVSRYIIGQNMGGIDSPNAIHDRAVKHARLFGKPVPLELALQARDNDVIRKVAQNALKSGVAVAGTAAEKPVLQDQFLEMIDFFKQF